MLSSTSPASLYSRAGRAGQVIQRKDGLVRFEIHSPLGRQGDIGINRQIGNAEPVANQPRAVRQLGIEDSRLAGNLFRSHDVNLTAPHLGAGAGCWGLPAISFAAVEKPAGDPGLKQAPAIPLLTAIATGEIDKNGIAVADDDVAVDQPHPANGDSAKEAGFQINFAHGD